MTPMAAILFSLFWGGLVWLISLAAASDERSVHFHPTAFLGFLAVLVLPSLVAASGFAIPLPGPERMMFPTGGAHDTILVFTAPITTLATNTGLFGFDRISSVVLPIYLFGVIVQLARLGLAWSRLRTCVNEALPLHAHRSRWPLLTTRRTIAPFAAGGLRPVIVIPVALMRQLPSTQINLIIAHEEAHLRRGDPNVFVLLLLMRALFWFNPFFRDLVSRWHQACELRADADVLRAAAADVRKSYAETLLAALRFAAGMKSNPLAVPFSLHKLRSQKMRVSKILKDGIDLSAEHPRRMMLHTGIAVLTLIGTVSALTMSSQGAVEETTSFIKGGWVTSSYGIKRKGKRDHTGVDVAAPRGTPILAPDDAVVLETADTFRGNWRWGKAVVLQFSDDVVGWFTHVDGFLVEPGDRIKKGTPFATMGNTGLSSGPHVHIETYKAGVRVDPVSIWGVLNFMRR